MKLKPIEQQVVAVVGASSGIGRETALQFAKRNAKVVVSARTESGLASLVDEITALGGDAIAIPADVAEFDQVKSIVDKTIDRYGRLDTWVHAAGTGIIAPFEQVTPEEFKRVIDVNLMRSVYGAMVAEAILHAAENPTRDMIVGDVGRVIDLLQKLVPDLTDTLVGAIAVPGQRTERIKATDDPNNLFEPIEGYDTTTGDFTDKTIPSFLDWFDFHPVAKWSTAVGLGAIALIAANLMREMD